MNAQDHKGIIERPDGSTIPFEKLPAAKQMEHEFVMTVCHEAQQHSKILAAFKRQAIAEMVARRHMLFEDHGVKKGGKDGNMTLRSACGRHMVKMTVSKHISFGPELEAAKALVFEIVEDELAKGASTFISSIVTKVFSMNERGRIDTKGILGLREINCDDDRWPEAMDLIDAAILKDASTTYINFFECDPQANPKSSGENRIPLNLAEL